MTSTPTIDTHDGYTAQQWAEMYHQAEAQRQDDLVRIADWQKRQTAERVTAFAVQSSDGEIKHETDDYNVAQQSAQFYSGATVVTRNHTTWKPVTPSATPSEQ